MGFYNNDSFYSGNAYVTPTSDVIYDDLIPLFGIGTFIADSFLFYSTITEI